ncbi:hypothetical protein [Rhodococcoides fascians]|uniref:hypothetical protein n=1 Tax=Rhodococcoides fascians TaxID=1828 RepID=UPI0005677340|nr:hypothetical protein [Rhodococcus fascians]
MTLLNLLHDDLYWHVDEVCDNCGYELGTHDDWPEPFCPDGCDGIYLDDAGDLVNDNGHPPTCRCPGICDPDYYHDQGR